MRAKTVKLGKLKLGTGQKLFLIAGPCVIESERHAMKMAERIARIARDLEVPTIFKASYDKANRTSVKSYRGPGLRQGLKVLARIRKEFRLPVLSDVHTVEEVAPAAEVCDILQIPAFLCRQTDLLAAAGRSGAVVNIKKGQFLAPQAMAPTVQKVLSTGNRQVLVTERGTCFGYNNLVVDIRSLAMMKRLGFPVVLDVTHSLQLPSAAGGASGGQPEFIEPLARAGVAAGVDGLFLEVHDNPAKALSDGPNSLPLKQLRGLLERLSEVAQLVRTW